MVEYWRPDEQNAKYCSLSTNRGLIFSVSGHMSVEKLLIHEQGLVTRSPFYVPPPIVRHLKHQRAHGPYLYLTIPIQSYGVSLMFGFLACPVLRQHCSSWGLPRHPSQLQTAYKMSAMIPSG